MAKKKAPPWLKGPAKKKPGLPFGEPVEEEEEEDPREAKKRKTSKKKPATKKKK
jgi:hypothetical protein